MIGFEQHDGIVLVDGPRQPLGDGGHGPRRGPAQQRRAAARREGFGAGRLVRERDAAARAADFRLATLP